MKLKRVACIADDFAFGHENVGGFQRVFEDGGGKVVQKLLPPLNAPDYGTYISQLKPDLDGIYTGHAGSNGFKLIKQLREYGSKLQILGGFTPVDESLLQQMGDDALGAITGNWYSAQLDSPINKRFVAAIQKDYKVDPGVYAAETYLRRGAGSGREGGQRQCRGQDRLHEGAEGRQPQGIDPRPDALRRIRQRGRQQSISARSSARTASCQRRGEDLSGFSQFWTYKPEEFLKQPVYWRDYPPAKNWSVGGPSVPLPGQRGELANLRKASGARLNRESSSFEARFAAHLRLARRATSRLSPEDQRSACNSGSSKR